MTAPDRDRQKQPRNARFNSKAEDTKAALEAAVQPPSLSLHPVDGEAEGNGEGSFTTGASGEKKVEYTRNLGGNRPGTVGGSRGVRTHVPKVREFTNENIREGA